ncbi:MAG: DNA-3-methyladenine glycosylase [Oscillospiraceae bacterium]|nr:DNA-3-methyladenine glycosylase [Oscillospiraceae bacterium]
MKGKILDENFFHRDVLEVAPDLVGKLIVRTLDDGTEISLRITETEAYRGEEDTACHASKGRTERTEVLYMKAGTIYVYLCYGVHWLMNVVTGDEGQPQAVLFRACQVYDGPGKLTKKLGIDKSFNRESFCKNPRIRIEDDGYRPEIETLPRVGIDYAAPEHRDALWRFADKDRKNTGKGKKKNA